MLTKRPIKKYDIITHSFHEQLGIFVKYNDIVDNAINEEQKKIQQYYDQLDPDERQGINFLDDLITEIDYYTPSIFISSSFLTIYSLFESYFKWFVDLTKELKLISKDNKGKNICDYYNYLDSHAKFDLDLLNNKWERINNFRHVRNITAHFNGYFKEYKNFYKVESFIVSNDYFKLEHDDKLIYTDKRIIEDFTDLVRSFIDELADIAEREV